MYRALIDLFGHVKATTIYTRVGPLLKYITCIKKNCDVLKKM